MSPDTKTTQRLRGIYGTGFASWILTSAVLVIPEWTRESDSKHCGVFFCCLSYGNCSVTDTEVVSDPQPWIFSSWMLNFVGLCSALCRCSTVHPSNVRHMAIMNVAAGVLIIVGSAQFLLRKYTTEFAEINLGACGIFAVISGLMLFISGCCGVCHGYGYYSNDYPQRQPAGNEVYPIDDDEMELGTTSTYNRNSPTPGSSGNRLARFRDNVFPTNFARRFWRDTIASTNETLTQHDK